MFDSHCTTRASQEGSLAALAPHHEVMLAEDNGMTPEVIAASGDWTTTKKRELQGLGFAPAQRRVPALVLPIHSVGGLVVNPSVEASRSLPKITISEHSYVFDSK